jgi:hypothetical protein
MPMPYPTLIPGLRSPYDEVGGLVHFGRMLDKIRLHAEGKLPEEWVAVKGAAYPNTFDARCCALLGVSYHDLENRVLEGGTDQEILEWAFATGRKPGAEEIEVWNGFMTKRGWRDAATQRLHERLAELGLPPGTVETMFDFIELDEGRQPRNA